MRSRKSIGMHFAFVNNLELQSTFFGRRSLRGAEETSGLRGADPWDGLLLSK